MEEWLDFHWKDVVHGLEEGWRVKSRNGLRHVGGSFQGSSEGACKVTKVTAPCSLPQAEGKKMCPGGTFGLPLEVMVAITVP